MTRSTPKITGGIQKEFKSVGPRVNVRAQYRTAIKTALILLGLVGVAHIGLGSNPIVPALAILTMALAMWPIARYGVNNFGAIILLWIAFRYVGFPMFAKLTLGQALDTNLSQPVEAFATVLLGIVSYLGAIVLANRVSTGKPLINPVTEPRMLLWISFVAFAIGFVANFQPALQSVGSFDDLTIANFFTPFLHLALIAGTAALLVKSGGRKIIDPWTLIIIVTEVAVGFSTGGRAQLIETFLCLILTGAAFKGHFNKKHIGAGVAAFVLLLAITPALLFVRGTSDTLSMYERIGSTIEALTDWEASRAALIDSEAEESVSAGFYLNYYGSPNNIFQRFSLVNDVDALIVGTGNSGVLGFEVLDLATQRVLPRFIAPDKPREYSEGDWIYCEFAFRCLYGNFQTASLIGVSYAAFGWVGVMVIPFFLGLALLLLVKKAVGFNMVGNIWSVFLLVALNNQLVEGGVAPHFAMLFRVVPQIIVVMLALAGLFGTKSIVRRKIV